MTDLSMQNNAEKMQEISLKSLTIGFFGVTIGLMVSVIVLPGWLPGLINSITGQDVKAFWYISRGSAIVAYFLLWLSMIFGLLMTNKMARYWPGSIVTHELHQFTSILGVFAVVLHALILLGDQYMGISFYQILIPLSVLNYRPQWVSLGQIGFYLWVILVISFYIRRRIGTKGWRLIHFVSFTAFIFAMVHGITSGTDTNTPWMAGIYWISAGSFIFLVVYRFLSAFVNKYYPSTPKNSA